MDMRQWGYPIIFNQNLFPLTPLSSEEKQEFHIFRTTVQLLTYNLYTTDTHIQKSVKKIMNLIHQFFHIRTRNSNQTRKKSQFGFNLGQNPMVVGYNCEHTNRYTESKRKQFQSRILINNSEHLIQVIYVWTNSFEGTYHRKLNRELNKDGR